MKYMGNLEPEEGAKSQARNVLHINFFFIYFYLEYCSFGYAHDLIRKVLDITLWIVLAYCGGCPYTDSYTRIPHSETSCVGFLACKAKGQQVTSRFATPLFVKIVMFPGVTAQLRKESSVKQPSPSHLDGVQSYLPTD